MDATDLLREALEALEDLLKLIDSKAQMTATQQASYFRAKRVVEHLQSCCSTSVDDPSSGSS